MRNKSNSSVAKQDKWWLYKKGQSGNPGGFHRNIRHLRETALAAYFRVFDELGGADGMLEWVKKNPRAKEKFYSWLIALMPKEHKIESETKGISGNRSVSITLSRSDHFSSRGAGRNWGSLCRRSRLEKLGLVCR